MKEGEKARWQKPRLRDDTNLITAYNYLALPKVRCPAKPSNHPVRALFLVTSQHQVPLFLEQHAYFSLGKLPALYPLRGGRCGFDPTLNSRSEPYLCHPTPWAHDCSECAHELIGDRRRRLLRTKEVLGETLSSFR